MKKTTLCQRILAFGILIIVSIATYIGINHLLNITGVLRIFSFIGACFIPFFLEQAFSVLYKLEEETKDLPSPGGAEGWW